MRWGDMDAYGHINNVEVIRILEEARIHAFGPPPVPACPGWMWSCRCSITCRRGPRRKWPNTASDI
ncbi:thioesterase family protein [Paenarthrobacter sp. PH39-S1]|uniref:thioesterase family protein n=1 Tax=Paenarthrobacter sp. PH39-S1 TaxID=3046204 RepID=UPI0032D9807D